MASGRDHRAVMSPTENAMREVLDTQHLFSVLDILNDIIVCVDKTSRITYVNSFAQEFFGLVGRDVVGRDIIAILPEKYHKAYKRFVVSCYEEDPSRFKGHLFHFKLDSQKFGAKIPVNMTVSIPDTEHGPMAIFIIRWRKLAPVLPANNEFSYKENLASIYHEIRNPLVAIGGFARLIEHDPGLNKNSFRNLKIIQEEVGRLERLLNIFSDLTKKDVYRFEHVDVAELLQHVVAFMGRQGADEGKEVVLDLAFNPPRLLLDKDKISQVLINLVRNALEACASGDRISVRLGQDQNSGFLRIDIADNGQGISRESLNKLFEPFFTTKKDGTGLGLAVSKRIVEDHGGSLKINSQTGEGTIVSIYLPL